MKSLEYSRKKSRYRRHRERAKTLPPPPRAEADSEEFSPLLLEDRVVIKLLYEELIRIEHVERAWNLQKERAIKDPHHQLWRALLDDPELDRDTIFAQAAAVYDFKPVRFSKVEMLTFLRTHEDLFTDEQWTEMMGYPVAPAGYDYSAKGEHKPIVFVTHDPTHPAINRFLHALNKKRFELRYAPEAVVVALLANRFRRSSTLMRQDLAFDFGVSEDVDLVDEETLDAEINRSALIHLFETVLTEAVRQGASDIHIVPNARRHIEILFRLDGSLHRWHVEERIHPEAFLAVVKDNSFNVDRFVRDKAQDGFIQRQVDGTLIRFRVSVLPVVNARLDIRSESIVIRILDDRKVVKDLALLGLHQNALDRVDWAIRQPYGMVVLTGPTGSGKSTTLNAALTQVATPDRNVITVEDPVEYVIPEVRQIKLSHQLTLDEALRAILRHDPDVVMVGEMRDRATAELAIKLANTGHLTFSTLHTNDAPSAVSRLYKMGVEPFLIAYAINLVVAQRLMRTLCPECKEPHEDLDPVLMERLGFGDEDLKDAQLFRRGSKDQCNICYGVGYKGRQAIAEVLPFTQEIRHIIVSAQEMIDEAAIRRQAIAEGMITQQEAARDLVLSGNSSLEEMMRVVFTSQ